MARIDRMREADIDYSDIPPLDKTFLKKATAPWPPVKRQLTIRLDADVLDWLKGHGRGEDRSRAPLPIRHWIITKRDDRCVVFRKG